MERVVNASERALFLLLPLFVASGCAALIYEIVWFQLLELVIGSSTVSLGILLATYMGGLCLGSLWLPRLVSARRSPPLVYGALEFGIGLCAIVLLFVLPSVGALYVAHAEHGLASIALRGALCAVLLLPPTILMGATLPAIARWVESSPQGVSWLGMLYAGNIAGAVLGSLLAGFYLLRIYDMAVATYVAAAINAALAIAAYVLAAESRRRKTLTAEPPAAPTAPLRAAPSSRPRVVYLVIALSGLTALGSQVIWNRVLGLMLGASVYTFSIILAVFLIGLGIGSGAGSLLARTSARPRLALGICQLLLAAGLAWAALMINGSLPYWPINPSLTSSPWYGFQLDLLRVTWAILPATFLWGASFPLALAAAASPGEDPGRLAGAVYAANTVGSIVGALVISTLLIPALGTSDCERLLIGISLLSGLAMLIALVPDREGAGAGAVPELPMSRAGMSLAFAGVFVAAMLLWIVPDTPAALIALGRDLPQWNPMPTVLYAGEGINSSIAVMELADGTRSFVVSGRPEASTSSHDMRNQRMIGHIAGLLHPKPRSVLVVGFGAGVTAGSFVTYPDVERIVICELEPLIPQVVSTYFTKENHDVLKDPRVEVVYDDARHYLLTTREHFDIITSDPIHPWVKGSAALYTREYFELAKSHLNPGGVVTQWVPFYESSLDVVKSELATFFQIFPRGLVFTNNEGEESAWGTDSILFGATDPQPIRPDRIQLRLYRSDYWPVRQSLAEVNFLFVTDLLSTYAGQAPDLVGWLKDAEINTDRDLRLQYLAGLASSATQGAEIYDDLLRQRRYPEGLFISSPETEALLRQALLAEAP